MGFSEEYLNSKFRESYMQAMTAKNGGNYTLAKQKFAEAADYLEQLARMTEGPKRLEYLKNATRLLSIAAAMKAENRGISPTFSAPAPSDGDPAPVSLYPVRSQPEKEEPLTVPEGMEQFFTFFQPQDLEGFESVIGLEQAKEAVREYVINPTLYPEAYNYDFLDNKAILLEGPPGTGKTTFAKAVASEIRQPFALVNVAALVNCYVGETGKNIDKVFAFLRSYTERNHCGITVFFDELDEIAKRRGGDDKASEAAVPALLRNLDGVKTNKAFLVLANTNRKDVLDTAIAERFRKQIYIPLPDLDMRRRLFACKLSDVEERFMEKLDLDVAADTAEGLSGRDITFLCDDFKYFLSKVKRGAASAEQVFDKLLSLITERRRAKNLE